LLAAVVLGVPAHKVLARVKRLGMWSYIISMIIIFLGGGFGGKETRSCMFSTSLAVAANK